jgi:hypothetical protein
VRQVQLRQAEIDANAVLIPGGSIEVEVQLSAADGDTVSDTVLDANRRYRDARRILSTAGGEPNSIMPAGISHCVVACGRRSAAGIEE